MGLAALNAVREIVVDFAAGAVGLATVPDLVGFSAVAVG